MAPQKQPDPGPEKVAFYVKSKPQGADIIELVRRRRRVFIGYPPWKRNGAWDRHDVRRSIFDLSDPTWEKGDIDSGAVGAGYRQQISANRNLVAKIGPGSMVAVPRPGRGLCYIGRVSGSFELVSNPNWANEYLELRQEQKLETEPEPSHIGDVVQSWKVDQWKEIAFPLIPRWITYRLLSRHTTGIIKDRPDGGQSSIDVLESMYDGARSTKLPHTIDEGEVVARLLTSVSPNALEHLACQLLQLEDPKTRWFHIGGSGDDGCDGLGLDSQGSVIGLLQCKWELRDDLDQLGDKLARHLRECWGSSARVYIASLFHEPITRTEDRNVTFLGSRDIARLLLKHAARCPMATTLDVGIPDMPPA